MTVSQKDGAKRNFKKTFRGYDTAEVDSYINAITENYNLLYRENARLARELADANDRLVDLTGEEEKVKKTLETARAAADKIVADAYERADAILASIKRSCDKILRSFRDKTEAQKAALSSMQENILVFKNELFERYRLHIELIERISPVFEYEEELTPEQYVEKVVSTMTRDVSEEFGIKLEGFDIDMGQHSDATEDNDYGATAVFAPQEEKPSEEQSEEATSRPAHRKRTVGRGKKTSVISLIDEYETPGVANVKRESGVQMSFDFDSESSSLSDKD